MSRLILLLLLAAPAYAQDADALARAYFAAWNAGDADALSTLVTDDVARRTAGVADTDGRDALLDGMRRQRERSPGFRVEVEEVVASGDRTAVAWRARTPEAEWTGSSHFRVADGRIAEERVVGDMLAMYRQRGYTLTPPAQGLDAVEQIRPRLDHFMWFVRDLDDASAFLADTLGFTLSQANYMGWGAENRLAWFEDDSYLEPLYLHPGHSEDYWGPFVARHQGAAAFGLRVPDAEAAHDYFAARGLRVSEPYAATFDRVGDVTDLPQDMWRVVSAADRGFLADLIFWIEYTDAWDGLYRDRPALHPRSGTTHANTARGTAHYEIATWNADRLAELFERLGLAVGPETELPHLDAVGREVRLDRGAIWLVQPRLIRSPAFAFLRQRGEGLMGTAIKVADLDAARRLIEGRSGWRLEEYGTPAGRAFHVPAEHARGVRLTFVEAP